MKPKLFSHLKNLEITEKGGEVEGGGCIVASARVRKQDKRCPKRGTDNPHTRKAMNSQETPTTSKSHVYKGESSGARELLWRNL